MVLGLQGSGLSLCSCGRWVVKLGLTAPGSTGGPVSRIPEFPVLNLKDPSMQKVRSFNSHSFETRAYAAYVYIESRD